MAGFDLPGDIQMKRSLKPLAQLSGIVLVSSVVLSCASSQALHGKSYSVIHTLLDIQSIELGMKAYFSELVSSESSGSESIPYDMNAVGIFKALSSNPDPEESYLSIMPYHRRWMADQRLVDRWGNDLNFKVVRLDRHSDSPKLPVEASVIIWSGGPNGRNEGGKGDDIVSEPFTIKVPSEWIHRNQ